MRYQLHAPSPSHKSVATSTSVPRANAWSRLPATAAAALSQGAKTGARRGRGRRTPSDGSLAQLQQADVASIQAVATVTAAPVLPAVTPSQVSQGPAVAAAAASAVAETPVPLLVEQGEVQVLDEVQAAADAVLPAAAIAPLATAAAAAPVPSAAPAPAPTPTSTSTPTRSPQPQLENEDQYGFDFDVLPHTLANLLAEATGAPLPSASISPALSSGSVAASGGPQPASIAATTVAAVMASSVAASAAHSKARVRRERTGSQLSPERALTSASQTAQPSQQVASGQVVETFQPQTQQSPRSMLTSPRQKQRQRAQGTQQEQQGAIGQQVFPQSTATQQAGPQQAGVRQSRWLSRLASEPAAPNTSASFSSTRASQSSSTLDTDSSSRPDMDTSKPAAVKRATKGVKDWGGFVTPPAPSVSPYTPSLGAVSGTSITRAADSLVALSDRPVSTERVKPRDEWWQLPWQEAAAAVPPAALRPQADLSPLRSGGADYDQAGDAATTLFIKGLPAEASEHLTRAALVAAYSKAGHLMQVRLPSGLLADGRRMLRGIAFLVFQTPQAKERALNELSESCVLGRWVRLDMNPDAQGMHGRQQRRRAGRNLGQAIEGAQGAAAAKKAQGALHSPTRSSSRKAPATGASQPVHGPPAAGPLSRGAVTVDTGSSSNGSSAASASRGKRRGGYLPA